MAPDGLIRRENVWIDLAAIMLSASAAWVLERVDDALRQVEALRGAVRDSAHALDDDEFQHLLLNRMLGDAGLLACMCGLLPEDGRHADLWGGRRSCACIVRYQLSARRAALGSTEVIEKNVAREAADKP